MSKHPTLAISGDDLLSRVSRDSDTPWRDVIGWNCEALDRLEAVADPTPEQERERDELDFAQRQQVADRWWIVSWPNHVIVPRFNSDASYHHGDEAEARANADECYR